MNRKLLMTSYLTSDESTRLRLFTSLMERVEAGGRGYTAKQTYSACAFLFGLGAMGGVLVTSVVLLGILATYPH